MQKSLSTIHHRLSTIHYALFTILLILLAGQQAVAQTAVSEAENDKPSFTIEGEVLHAGSFPLTKNFRVKDAVKASGGLTKDADSGRAEIIRFNKRQNNYYTIYFQVANALSGDLTDNFVLLDKDRVVIHKIQKRATTAQPERTSVSISGQIAKPGDYPYTAGMTVKDLVRAGGNILKTSYPDEAEVFSIVSDGDKLYSSDRKIIHLQKAMEGDPEHNIQLKPDDRLFIKMIPDVDALLESVSVTGEFRLPGKYPITKGERLSSVIMRAGGYTNEAYLRGAVFTRQKAREMQQRSIDEITDRLERELLSASSAQVATTLSADEVQAQKLEMEQKRLFIDNLRKSKALGRMTIKLAHLRLLKGSEYDIEIQDGDSLVIPKKNSIVGVAGAVMSQGAYIYREKADYQDYIEMSGGYTRYADVANVYVLKVDGSARKASKSFINWNNKKERYELSAFSEKKGDYIEPGDVIAVPENFERIAWLRKVLGINQILVDTAIASGNLVLLIRSF